MNRQESYFCPKRRFFSRSKPDCTVSRNGKRYISDKIEVRLEHVDCLRVNAKSILPPWRDREITRLLVTSPMGMLDPRCEAILRYHASLTTYHCERSLDNLKPVEPYATSYTVPWQCKKFNTVANYEAGAAKSATPQNTRHRP